MIMAYDYFYSFQWIFKLLKVNISFYYLYLCSINGTEESNTKGFIEVGIQTSLFISRKLQVSSGLMFPKLAYL